MSGISLCQLVLLENTKGFKESVGSLVPNLSGQQVPQRCHLCVYIYTDTHLCNSVGTNCWNQWKSFSWPEVWEWCFGTECALSIWSNFRRFFNIRKIYCTYKWKYHFGLSYFWEQFYLVRAWQAVKDVAVMDFGLTADSRREKPPLPLHTCTSVNFSDGRTLINLKYIVYLEIMCYFLF